MRIGTWNIGEDERHEKGILNLNSYDYIVEIIKNSNLDVVCLQEAITSSNNLPAIGKYIKGHTALKYSVQLELSISHVDEDNKIGVVICSKYELDNVENLMFDNPNVTYYNKEKGKTYRPADKGMIMADIEGIKIITGHGIPFYAFHIAKAKRHQYCEKLENHIVEVCKGKNWVLMGDLNEDDLNVIFPRINNMTKDLVKEATYKDKIYDHILISKGVEKKGLEVVDTCFDHKLCIIEI